MQIPGKTNFSYTPFDGLQVLQQNTLGSYGEGVNFATFEELYQAYLQDLRVCVEVIVERFCYEMVGKDQDGNWIHGVDTPCTVISLFEGGCIENGRSYLECGTTYNIRSPHFGGLPDVTNSLYAIKKLVYEEKRCTLPQFLAILRNDWEGEEVLRQYVLNRYAFFGNDNDACDEIAVRLVEDFASICKEQEGRCCYSTPGGISTFGRQLEWAPHRLATPFGKKKGAILAGNLSPTPGTDRAGATAVIRSFSKPDLRKMVTGAALDIKLLPSAVKGEDGIAAITGLMKGFCTCGGYFMQQIGRAHV